MQGKTMVHYVVPGFGPQCWSQGRVRRWLIGLRVPEKH